MRQNIQEWQQQDWNRQNSDWRQQRREWNRDKWRNRQKGDKVWFGAIVALFGVFLLLKKLGLFYFDWDIIWPVCMMVVGLLIGIKNRFHNHAWWILMLVGGAFLIPEFTIGNTTSSHLVFPLALIIGGFMIAVRSKRHKEWNKVQVVTSDENTLNIDITFGGRKEIVTSKQFKGGNISTTFGGCEVNMLQADSTEQPMVLNLKVAFGGIELIVPSHWELQNEIQPTLGNVEDHRAIRTGTGSTPEEKKILILRGTCNFGSIEIKSY